ncbi:hypothetical protein OKW21_003860 [Catalinimonas alkaloidigena]|uniref:hypothetical protein n=1 Tax=Catalinimonas alkaloidigena TaxID=1075417 RepID=UPI002406FF00|nr:hypothetical protein [Catalinimonas alkaloidigena]MDF9798597.1 hypothetical protein [Catalinimonas alkaloidigena]
MLRKADLHSTHNSIAADSLVWLEQAELLNISAISIYQNLIKSYSNHNLSPSARSKATMGFMGSYMLLSGYAFENLIKGVSIARFKDESLDILKQKRWNYRKGHGISSIARDLIDDVTKDELDLLSRFEEFVIWGGRYPVPLKESMYSQSYKLRLKGKDFQVRNKLFNRLRNILVEEWEEGNNEKFYGDDGLNEFKNAFDNTNI